MNRALSEVSGRQYGMFTARQAEACDLPVSSLYRHVAEGRLLLPHPGVFALAGSPASADRSLMAAILAAGPGAVASHRSAARLWGIPDDDAVELSIPRSRCPRLRGVVVHRSSDLAGHHISVIRGFPLTKPARVIVDLAAVLPPEKVEDALDRALTRRIEVDGWESHSSPQAMGKDFVRQNGLVPYGWRVLRFTWAQVVRQPEYVAATIGAALESLAA